MPVSIYGDGSISGVSTLSTQLGVVTATTFSGDLTGNVTGNLNSSGVSTISQLNVGTGGTVITTTAGGLVGVGTESPGSKIHLSAASGTLQMQISNGGNPTYIGHDSAYTGFDIAAGGGIRFRYHTGAAYATAAVIDTSGRVLVHNQMQFTDGASGNDKGAIQAFGDDFSNGNLRFYTKGSGSLDERLRIDSSGRVTMPYQPIASLSDSNTNNVTNAVLNSSNFYNTTWLNQGNHFDASTGRFNCPVNGVYRIYFRCSQNGDAGKTNVRLRKNGATINEAYSNITNDSVSSEAVVSCTNIDYLDIQVAELHAIGGSQHKQVTFQLLY